MLQARYIIRAPSRAIGAQRAIKLRLPLRGFRRQRTCSGSLATLGRTLLMEAVCQALADDWQDTRTIQIKLFGPRPTDKHLDDDYRRLALISLTQRTAGAWSLGHRSTTAAPMRGVS